MLLEMGGCIENPSVEGGQHGERTRENTRFVLYCHGNERKKAGIRDVKSFNVPVRTDQTTAPA
jgi:hypothetical protein